MMRRIKQLIHATLLLLCSCVTSGKVQDYLAKEENKPAAKDIVSDWLGQNREWYAEKAASDFPLKKSVAQQIQTVPITIKGEPAPCPERPCPETAKPAFRRIYTPLAECPDVAFFEKTIREKELVIQENTQRVKAAQAALKREQAAHKQTKKQLQTTEVARDYYMELNRKKFWSLVAMGIFALLFIVFRVLASRIKAT